jgi:predicted O-methyltransferase YrrM
MLHPSITIESRNSEFASQFAAVMRKSQRTLRARALNSLAYTQTRTKHTRYDYVFCDDDKVHTNRVKPAMQSEMREGGNEKDSIYSHVERFPSAL